jgi:hypothetical protein
MPWPIPAVPPELYRPVRSLSRAAHHIVRLLIKLADGADFLALLRRPRQYAALQRAIRTIYDWNRHLPQSSPRRRGVRSRPTPATPSHTDATAAEDGEPVGHSGPSHRP